MSIRRIYKCSQRKYAQIILSFLLVAGIKSKAQLNKPLVSPLQTGHYSPGSMNIRDEADPAPDYGLTVLDYNTYQYGNKFYDKNGKQVTQIKGPAGNLVNLDPDVSGYNNTLMFQWAFKRKILGATYFCAASIPFETVNTNLVYSKIGNIDSLHQSGNVSGKVSGFSDASVSPLALSWRLKNMDISMGWMIYAPSGQFSEGGSNNTGFGFWSNIFQVFGYWYPEKLKGQPSETLAVMLGASFEATGTIKGSDVEPGNRFSLDYGIEQYLSDNFSVGIYGSNNWQVTEDRGSQVYWDASVKDRLGTWGFQLGYWLWANRLQALGKCGFSYGAVQRFQQNLLEINLIFVTNALAGNKKSKTKS